MCNVHAEREKFKGYHGQRGVTCHLHGLKERASLKWSRSKCTARNDAKTFHPLGIV